MPWVKFDDGFDDEPEIDNLSDSAVALYFTATTWSSRNLTDGFIPFGRVRKLPGGSESAAEELCNCGGDKPWWIRVEGGYQIRSFLKYNPSAAEVEAQRNTWKNKKAGQKKPLISETPAGIPQETPSGIPGEIPNKTPEGNPVERLQEKPQGNPAETPEESPSGLLNENPSGNPQETPSRVSRIPYPVSRISPNPVPGQTSSEGGDAPRGRFDRTKDVLILLCEALGWDPPRDPDVRRELGTKAGGLQDLLAWLDERKNDGRLDSTAEEAAVSLYVLAHSDWAGRVSWPAVHRKREDLFKQRFGGSPKASESVNDAVNRRISKLRDSEAAHA